MAGYTSRLFLVLAVPSLFGVLSILFFKKRRASFCDTKSESQTQSSVDNLSLNSMKLKSESCCIEKSTEMQLKENQANESSNGKNGHCYVEEVQLIENSHANGISSIENILNPDITKPYNFATNSAEVSNGEIQSLKVKETGARPKIRKTDSAARNGSSVNGANNAISNGNSESQSQNGIKKSKQRKQINGSSTNGVSKHSSFNGSHSVDYKFNKKTNEKSYENNHTSFLITIDDCQKDNSVSKDNLSELSNGIQTLTICNDNSLPDKDICTVETENLNGRHPVIQSDIRTIISDQLMSSILSNGNESSSESSASDMTEPETAKECDTSESLKLDTHCETPESGRSSNSSETTENPQIDINDNLNFDGELVASGYQVGNGEFAYCDSVNTVCLRFENYEVYYRGFFYNFPVPRICASILKYIPSISRWTCPYFPEAEDSSDSGKGGSEIHFSTENQRSSMVYEFDLPSKHCGLLIGKRGCHVNSIKEKTNTNIIVNDNPFNIEKKIVAIYGEEDDIKAALELIREKFPESRFPSITLEPTSHDAEIICPPSLKLTLTEGVEFQVILSATINAGHFFVQLPTHPLFHALLPFTMAMTSMYTECDTPAITTLSIGSIVAAPVSNGWFRAEVMDVLDDDKCKLKYLDYGGYQIVSRSELRQINIEFMQMPFQAIECYLANVSCFEEVGWTLESKATFEDLAQNQILSAYVAGVAEDGIPCLYLYQVTGATNTFVNQALVETGLLKWITYDQ